MDKCLTVHSDSFPFTIRGLVLCPWAYLGALLLVLIFRVYVYHQTAYPHLPDFPQLLAEILILSSYVPFSVTVLTFLFSITFARAYSLALLTPPS